jgi:hypothetical protein
MPALYQAENGHGGGGGRSDIEIERQKFETRVLYETECNRSNDDLVIITDLAGVMLDEDFDPSTVLKNWESISTQLENVRDFSIPSESDKSKKDNQVRVIIDVSDIEDDVCLRVAKAIAEALWKGRVD